MGSIFKPAVKYDAKLRLALCGPAGSGKTYGLLTLATELGIKIAYVDTEHGSASKYADLFNFDVVEPSVFDPRELVKTIHAAVENSYDVICVDSLTHYWTGTGGELDQVDAAAKRTQGNSFAAWKTVTPIHNALVEAILSAPIHVLVGMRTKTDWIVEKDERTGKSAPRKIGLAPIMRDGIEFEFDVCGDLDQDNNLTISKSRCPALTGKVINRLGKPMADTLKIWLASDVKQPTAEAPPSQDPAMPEVPKPDAQRAPAPIEAMWGRMAKDKFEALKVFGELKARLIQLRGDDGQTLYYDILEKHGTKKADEFKTRGDAKRCSRSLYEIIERLAEADAQKVAAEPPAEVANAS